MDSLLKIMIDESDPLLPFGYIKLDEVFMKSITNCGLLPLKHMCYVAFMYLRQHS